MSSDTKVRLSPVEELYLEEMKYGSYIRALTDDFSVIDRVQMSDGGNSNE